MATICLHVERGPGGTFIPQAMPRDWQTVLDSAARIRRPHASRRGPFKAVYEVVDGTGHSRLYLVDENS